MNVRCWLLNIRGRVNRSLVRGNDLARICKYQHRRRRAIALLREAVRLPTYTSEDLTMNRLCQQLLTLRQLTQSGLHHRAA